MVKNSPTASPAAAQEIAGTQLPMGSETHLNKLTRCNDHLALIRISVFILESPESIGLDTLMPSHMRDKSGCRCRIPVIDSFQGMPDFPFFAASQPEITW